MSIKKKLKKEKGAKRNIIIFTSVLMLIVTYVVMTLYDLDYFKGYERYLFLIYLAVVDSLLFFVILRTIADNRYEFRISGSKIRIKDGAFTPAFFIPGEWIIYVDACERQYNKGDFEILLVMNRGKRCSRFSHMDERFLKVNKSYINTYPEIRKDHENEKLYFYFIRKSGAKKYYYLFLIYKNFYNVKFSRRSLDYIKELIDEYKL